ncbi:MAG: type I-B CRISPR-associated endonuclease Cas1b [Paenibacillus macerans]|uniref:type I-B CRISPR-associated endonuclease Cas1b n=1 Tax=Paenibacillus TaxID=44249 RepID=UPI0022DF71BB|nr:type I-B CRISPR-associated endonuclease Cas1b [Paenibacillus macerans]MBS5909967.1 type I-B CRISPR-associated endonuclease Cas1 [Paenibacillus macerans]MDU7476063.1 type I-B CRISPR-associated endonuclease Cas1b [Paenibacillus macerans]MEC0138308.1 type I-B CRISPR-associated endonuclease Cas1b [Paenibacillus macerans]
MSRDVFVFSTGKLHRKHNTLYFTDEEEKSSPLPVEQTENLHLFGNVDFNTSLLHILTQHDVRLHVYNHYGYYDGTYYPRNSRVSGYTVIRQSEHYLDLNKRLVLAKSFIQGGVHYMVRNLRKAGDESKPYIDTIQSKVALLENASNIPSVMGVEGQCRQVYYETFPLLAKNSSFTWESHSKRPPRDPLNALISFGNGLMYTSVVSELYKTMLDPAISYLHEPSSKRFSLSLDIAEIFKPFLIDPLIFSLVNNRRIQAKHFDDRDGIVYLTEEGRKIFLATYDEKMKTTIKHRKLKRNVTYRYLIRLEAYKLIKHVIGDESYKPFKAWW